MLNFIDLKNDRDFFKILLVGIVLDQPMKFLKKLYEVDPSEMYERAQESKIQFQNYHQWLVDDI